MPPTDRPVEPGTESLTYQDFQQVLIGTVTQLTALADLAKTFELTTLDEAIDRMLARLNAGSFSVAVVGEFKRGKTTFINALLGYPVLPADAVPCSATVSRLIYGRTPHAEIHFRSGEVRAVDLAELDRYITQVTDEATVVAATVRQAVVAYPTLFCQNNVVLIDTPGLSDAEAFTRLTLDVIPSSDAAVFVVSALTPFSNTEGEFLLRMLETFDLDRLLFVVNRIDQINDNDAADRAIARVRHRISEIAVRAGLTKEPSTDIPTVADRLRIFGLSAYRALQAKLTRNTEELTASRLPDFEQILEQFLVRDRGVVSLKPALELLTEGGRVVLAALATWQNDDRTCAMALDPQMRRELDTIATEASTREHRLPERVEAMRTQLAERVATLEPELIAVSHEAIASAQTPHDTSLKPNELADHLSSAVERAIQQANAERRAALKADLDHWISEELAELDVANQRLDAVAAQLPTSDETTTAMYISRDRDWIEVFRRQIDIAWPDFVLGKPAPDQADQLLGAIARPALGLLGDWVGSETVTRGVSSIFRRFGTNTEDKIAKGMRGLQGALNDGMKATVRTHAERTIQHLVAQAARPAYLEQIVADLGQTLRELLHREVEHLVRRAYAIQADWVALEERQRAAAVRRQTDAARLRERTEAVLAAGTHLSAYLSR